MKKAKILGPLALLIVILFTNCDDSADTINVQLPDQESITGPENLDGPTSSNHEVHHEKFSDWIFEEDPVDE